MRFKTRFSAVLRRQRTTGTRRYTAKTVKKPYWSQSKRKPSVTFCTTTASLHLRKSEALCWNTINASSQSLRRFLKTFYYNNLSAYCTLVDRVVTSVTNPTPSPDQSDHLFWDYSDHFCSETMPLIGSSRGCLRFYNYLSIYQSIGDFLKWFK